MKLKQRGAEVIGVFVPEDGADAKRRLLECGISDVIETDATPEEFIDKIRQTMDHRPVADPVPALMSRKPLSIGVTGPSEGVGMTEVSIALARSLASRVDTVLVDLDPTWPAVAQRLDLPLHPNIRTALDHTLHSPDRLASALHHLDALRIVGGRADGGVAASVGRHEMMALVDSLADMCQVVIADLGPIGGIEGGALREFDTAVLVGAASPVGVARLMKSIDKVMTADPDQSVLVVANLPTRSSFRRSETLGELSRAFPGVSVVSLPFDKRLADAAWNGTAASGTRYRRAVRAVADVIVKSLA
jgi:MinD-like ATPase involved in chromosome partitioning or flagellar assembly